MLVSQEICDYLWTFLGGDCLKDCKRSDIKLFLPVFPDTFFWTGVDPQEASIDLDTWINLLHRYFGRWTRLHVHLDLSFHEDECECENCMNDPKRVDSQNQTNKGKGSSSNAENWSKSPAASDRPESVGTSMERSQAKPSPQSGRKRKLGTALGIKENPGCTCGKCKTVYRSKRAMDTDTEPGEISDQGISNRPSVV